MRFRSRSHNRYLRIKLACLVSAGLLACLILWFAISIGSKHDSSVVQANQAPVKDLFVGTQKVVREVNEPARQAEIVSDSALVTQSQREYLRGEKVAFKRQQPPVAPKVREDLFEDANDSIESLSPADSPNAELRKVPKGQSSDSEIFDVAPQRKAAIQPGMLARSDNLSNQGEIAVLGFSDSIDRQGTSRSTSRTGFENTFAPGSVAQVVRMPESELNQGHDYSAWAPRLMSGKLPALLKGWKTHRVDLVSISKFNTPRAYKTPKDLPSIAELRSSSLRTRATTDSELAAVRRIVGKQQEVVVDRIGDTLGAIPTLVVSIRAKEACQKCHRESPGTLMGALSFQLVPDGSMPNVP